MDDDDKDEDEDEDKGDNDEAPVPCADTLQDLLHTVRKLIASQEDVVARFALLDGAPWKALTVNSPIIEGEMEVEQPVVKKLPMNYKGEPLLLDLI